MAERYYFARDAIQEYMHESVLSWFSKQDSRYLSSNPVANETESLLYLSFFDKCRVSNPVVICCGAVSLEHILDRPSLISASLR